MPYPPYLIFSENGNISDCSDFANRIGRDDNAEIIGRTFIDALAPGDLADVIRFCRRGYSEEHDNFRIIPLVDFYSFNYLFLEKNTVSGSSINAGFLGHDIFDFADLISPSTAIFQSVSGRCISDILGIKPGKNYSDGITPEMLLISENFSEIKNEILHGNIKNQFCDISVVISSILDAMKDEEFYPYADISVIVPDLSNASESNQNHKIPVCTFVYLFTAVISLLAVLSDDHKIDINLNYHRCFAEIGFTVNVKPNNQYENALHSSLEVLGEYAGSYRILAKAASAIAFSSGINTSVDISDGILNTCISLDFFAESKPGFNYNDPYKDIASVVSRVLCHINSIKKVAG